MFDICIRIVKNITALIYFNNNLTLVYRDLNNLFYNIRKQAEKEKQTLLKDKLKIDKIICIILCVTALIGFILPAVHIDINFLGNSSGIKISMASLFDRPDLPIDSGNLPQIDIMRDNNIFSDISSKFISSVIAYILTFILLIVILVLTILEKLKKPGIIITAVSCGLYIYAGYSISNLTETLIKTLQTALENTLGFFAGFINIADMIKIYLGNGYFLTLIAITAFLLTQIIFLFINKRREL